jgi:hypothetical protein
VLRDRHYWRWGFSGRHLRDQQQLAVAGLIDLFGIGRCYRQSQHDFEAIGGYSEKDAERASYNIGPNSGSGTQGKPADKLGGSDFRKW